MAASPAVRYVRVAAIVICLATIVVRLLAHVGFPNDHFLYLAPAQQMHFGEWPSRDFVDPGTPLMYVASYLAQLVIAPPLLAEVWLVATAFGVAAGLTLVAAYRVSGRLWLATLAALAEVALFPRSYHYPKILAYAATALALFAYVERPTRRRAAVVAACVVAAFLFRHDHGVYLGGAAVAAAALAASGWRQAVRRIAEVVVLVFLFSAPYLIYLGLTTGIAAHIASGVAYSQAEAQRTVLGLPAVDLQMILTQDGIRLIFFYALHALPILVLGVLVARIRQRPTSLHRDVAQIAPVALLALAVNLSMLRDPLQARLPDVAVPALLLGSWLGPRAWHAPRARLLARALTVGAGVVSLVAVLVVGTPVEHLNHAELLERPGDAVDLVFEHVFDIARPLGPRTFPSGSTQSLTSFIEYLRRCTAPNHRLFIAGDLPELYVLAGRPFAGGQPALRGGFFETVADQRRLVSRLREQTVPLAVVVTDSDAPAFRVVMEELNSRFARLTEIPMRGRANLVLLGSRSMVARGVDASLGLPCFQ